MNKLDSLAVDLHAFVASDSIFQRKARILQSLWREKCGHDPRQFPKYRLGSSIPMPFAREEMANFLDKDICNVVHKVLNDHDGYDARVIQRDRLFSNLLSSQPMAFNLFAHLIGDLPLATKCMRDISRGRIHSVTRVLFEHSDGRGDKRYTGDHSAFDVCVLFDTSDGKPGLAGIEVKYHESLRDEPSDHHREYDRVAQEMGCFLEEARDKLRKKPIQQIWRDHLLVGAHRKQNELTDGFFVFLSPKENDACSRAVALYRSCLSCSDTFEHWTLESLVAAIKRATGDKWIRDFEDRYLNFTKLDAMIAAQSG